jgi:2'-5' RNA ligase
LEQLAAHAEDAAQQAGLDPEDRPFHPHLTLSRIRPHQDVRPLIAETDPFPLTLPVDRLIVYRSHLGRGGARYEELESFDLGS